MAEPIWKDYNVTLGQDESILFRIRIDGDTENVIYSGRANIRPGDEYNVIRINDICADYLKSEIPALTDGTFAELDYPTFIVETYQNDAWAAVGNGIQFYPNWSYRHSFNPSTMGIAAPINGRIDLRQWIMWSAINRSGISISIKLASGVIQTRSITASGDGTAVFNLNSYQAAKELTIGNNVYKVVSDCKEWALYYQNAYGGWDTFLIEGEVAEKDNLTRHNQKIEYSNTNIINRGEQNYVNEISKTYTLHTSWLSDEEAARMHHLLNSCNVYLYNMNTGEMMPVVLNNNTTEYKTFKGNNGALVDYIIEVTVAQDMIRK